MNNFLKKHPLVSFVVSVYNLEQYVAECLDSILAQPFNDYEIVLVNNNSTDGSDKICRDYAARFPQIRYYALDGKPVEGRAVRYGTVSARGKYIHIVDCDDMLHKNIYGEIFRVLLREKPDILFGQFSTFYENPTANFVDTPYDPLEINESGKDHALDYLAKNLPLHLTAWRIIFSRRLHNKIYSRALIIRMPQMSKSAIKKQISPSISNEDILFMISQLLAAQSLYYIDKPVYAYRIRRSSISRVSTETKVLECLQTILRLNNHLFSSSRIRAKTPQERNFVSRYIESYYYLMNLALCTLTDADLYHCVSGIMRIRKYFRETALKIIEDKTSPYAVFISAFFSDEFADGIKIHREQCLRPISRIASDILSREGKVYLVPTGNAGVYLKKCLVDSGVQIAGFFDNDKQKDGMLIDGVAARVPDAVIDMAPEERDAMLIVIASMYANVREDIKRQFLDLGINERNLYVLEF